MMTLATLLLTSAADTESQTASAGFTLDAGIVAAVISAAVAIVVAFLSPVFQSRRQRRDAVNAKFDTALGSLLTVQAARHFASGMSGVPYPGSTDQRAEFERQTAERGITTFIDLTGEAKSALADVAPYVSQARDWVTSGWEIREDKEPEMREIIERARAAAIKTERLFRSRKYAK